MAFHVACPITCRRICDCELGFPRELRAEKARGHFLDEISALEEFLADPWLLRVGGGEDTDTVRVPVPRVVVPTPYQHQAQAAAAVAAEGGGEGEESAKRAALQRQALEASIAAEDYVRRLEAGGDADLLGEGAALAAEDQGSSVVKVICRICFSGEKEGSNKALKMLPCRICNKKYHTSCLKSWAKNRDLFHWNSWACPSCRICEVCRRAGDPNKLMYCRRCDGAYHCYCQQPPHKNVGHGPYVCPKHTRCHSCGSSVPGSGPSTRWFLGYTCCDACGRLFVKGNYCPVCLKVYRDSETTPMVCCDVCERWVHCGCDGISDEKYQQFQANENLQYQCAACRGDCYQVKDIDDAVRELWRRKDEADHELMASLRASAALPSQDETSASPNSDDNQCGPVVLKNDYGKPLKFSVKNSKENERSISKNLSPNKNYANKKAFHIKFVTRPEGSYQHSERQKDETPPDGIFRDQKPNVTNSYMNDGPESLLSSRSTSLDKNGLKSSVNQSERNKYSPVKEIGDNNAGRFSKVKSENNNLPGLQLKECSARTASKKEIVKGTKLVIHLGSKNRNVSSSPRSETSSCHKEQDLAASYYGSEDTSQLKARDHETHMHESCTTIKRDEKGAKFDNASQTRSSKHGDRDKNVIKLGKVSDVQKKSNGNIAEESELVATCATSPISTRTVGEATPWNDSEVVIPRKKRHSVGPSVNQENDTGHQASRLQFVSGASFDPKPLLKLKFKNPYFEQRSSWVPRGQEESPIKGQRSKRKRPSELEKINASAEEDDSSASQLNHQENPLTDEVMDANWILQKLGKDAIGKRVEVYQPSDRSWCEGVVSNVTIQGGKGTTPSSLLVHLDDGRRTTLELGKQAVRFVSHKQAKKARK